MSEEFIGDSTNIIIETKNDDLEASPELPSRESKFKPTKSEDAASDFMQYM